MFRTLLLVGLAICSITSPGVARASRQEGGSAGGEASPEVQALRIYKTVRDQDWRTLYFLIAVSPAVKRLLPSDPDEFAKQVREGYEAGFKSAEERAESDQLLSGISDMRVGEPVITGGKADVPTSAKLTVNGRTIAFRGVAHMIKDGGVWKWDLTISDDVQAVTSQRVIALIGSPDTGQR